MRATRRAAARGAAFFFLALGGAGCGRPAPEAAPAVARTEYLMGTLAEIRIEEMEPGRPPEKALEEAFAEIRRLERVLSDRDGELADLSARLGKDSIPVSADLGECLGAALAASEASHGAFDPTLGRAVEAWGFLEAPYGPAPAPAKLRAAAASMGWWRIRLGGGAVSSAGQAPFARLDLGGIGKGFAADAAARVLREKGVRSAIIDLGGNLRTVGLPPGKDEWRIGVRHPRREGSLLGVILAGADAGISTSGDAERFFIDETGRRRHHILDPRTAAPAEGVVSVTVVAPDAATADAWSTAAFVLGFDTGARVLKARGLGGLLARETPEGLLVRATHDLAWEPEE